MAEPVPLSALPRPELYEEYDAEAMEHSFQAVELDLAEKLDRRGHLFLDPGKELVLTADNSAAQYGLGIGSNGYLRLTDMSDGTVGTFTVAWAQVDGAAQEITNLTTYVDDQDATLQSSIAINANTLVTQGNSLSALETELTAARDGEASLLAQVNLLQATGTSNAGAIAVNSAELVAARDGESSLLAKVNSIDTAITTGDTAEATARTAAVATLNGQLGAGNNLLPNSTFQDVDPAGATGLPRGWSSASTGGTYLDYVTGSGTWIGYFLPEERSYVVQQTDADNTVIHDTRTGKVYVEPSKNYEFSAYTGAHGCTVQAIIEFYNSSDTYLSGTFSDESNVQNALGGTSLSSWKRIGGVVEAPANAHYALLNFRKGGGAAVNSFMFLTRPMLAEALDDQTGISPYVPSAGELSASVVTNSSAIADIEGNLEARYAIAVDGGGGGAFFSLEDGTAIGSTISLSASEIILDGDVLTTGTVARTALSSAERDALGAEGVAANFYRQGTDPGSVPDGSWWADTGDDELKIRISSAWQTVANITTDPGPAFTASITGTANGTRSGAGSVTSSSVTATFSNGSGSGVTYRWATNPADSSENVVITSPTSASTTVSATIGSTDNYFGGLTCFVTDTGTGQTVVASTSYSLSAI